MVMVVRLIGLSVGLAALTAWALSRFNSLRADIELPPLDDPEFQNAVIDAQATLTADAIAETFLAHGAGVYIGSTQVSAGKTNSSAADRFLDTWDASETIGKSLWDLEYDRWGKGDLDCFAISELYSEAAGVSLKEQGKG